MSQIEIYDTTLRDGTQREGISLTVAAACASGRLSWRPWATRSVPLTK